MEINRHSKMVAGLAVAALVLVGKLFYIQIINDKYKESAENNSMVYETIYPPRGLIYDRYGKILVDNKVSYDIMVTPREVKPFDTLALAGTLGLEPDFIREKMAYYRQYRTRIGFQTLTFVKQLDIETYMHFAEVQYRFPGFAGRVRNTRDYPYNAGGNLLGYISEVDGDYIKEHPGYRSGDYYGRTGIESARESDLRGETGYHIYLRDSRNRVQTRYKDGELDKDAVPGRDVVTTIDAELQQYGQALMKGKAGSVIAIEPSTGEILAMVSSPGIDVNVLSDIGKYYPEIAKDKHKPMFNRTTQASYPPGSVFKLVNGLVGLEEGVLTPEQAYPCHSGYQYGAHSVVRCHAHKSPLELKEAIMASCNGYFCYVFKSILGNREKYSSTEEAFDAWREKVTSLGFGNKLGSDFPAELGGNIPTSKYYNKHYGKGHWGFSNVISLSIGQGEIGVTPLQIANLSATIANRGYYYIPHIVKDSDSIRIDPKYKERQYTKIDSSQFSKIIPGMWMAVNTPPGAGGTATGAAVPGLEICGKTGTAQNPHGDNHSVFICFAPKDNPKIAVAAFIENAGYGATWACPIASLMIERYLTGTIRPERKPVEQRMMGARLIR